MIDNFYILYIVIPLFLICLLFWRKSRDFFHKNHNVLNVMIALYAVIVASISVPHIIVKIDSLVENLREVYKTQKKQIFCFNDIQDSYIQIEKDKSSIQLILNDEPIKNSLTIYIGTQSYHEYEINDKKITLILRTDNKEILQTQLCNPKYNDGIIVTYFPD